MGMLADQVDYVIGVDTHRDWHAAAVCSPSGAVTAEATVATDAIGYKRLLRFARTQAPGRRVWAIEGTGSFGAGLTGRQPDQHDHPPDDRHGPRDPWSPRRSTTASSCLSRTTPRC